MTLMLWCLFALFVAAGIAGLICARDGGYMKTVGMCLFDSACNFGLAMWILWYLK